MSIEHNLEQYLVSQLDAGERVLWSGRPQQGLKLHPSDAVLIPFSLLWGGFAFFWEYQVVSHDAPLFFALWGIPFVVIGVYLIAGRFFWDAKRRSRALYGVTDKRVILISGVRRRQVRSINLRTLTELAVTERSNGVGDIALGAAPWMWSRFAGSGWPGIGSQLQPTLESISQSRHVYETIRQAQSKIA